MVTLDQAEALRKLEATCHSYLRLCAPRSPHEMDRIRPLLNRIESKSNMWDRSDMRGHITASALALHRSSKTCLFVEHLAIGSFLLPGGHCDPYEAPHETAIREFVEETGISDLTVDAWHLQNDLTPLDIDVHPIRENPQKSESDHLHFDFRYILNVDNRDKINFSKNEIKSASWVQLDKLKEFYPTLRKKLESLR